MTDYERNKIKDMVQGMTDEEISVVCGELEKRKRKHNQTIEYKAILNINAFYDFCGYDNLVSDREFAENLQQFISDEIAQSGGVAVIDIVESVLNVK